MNVAPFPMTWAAGNALGRHVLVVQATDMADNVLTATRDLHVLTQACNVFLGTGRYFTSSHDTVNVSTLTVVQGQPVAVHGVCASGESVQQVEFYIDGASITWDQIAPYGAVIETASLAPGTHSVSIIGRLAGGASSTHAITLEVLAP
jgi:hypothetical protein